MVCPSLSDCAASLFSLMATLNFYSATPLTSCLSRLVFLAIFCVAVSSRSISLFSSSCALSSSLLCQVLSSIKSTNKLLTSPSFLVDDRCSPPYAITRRSRYPPFPSHPQPPSPPLPPPPSSTPPPSLLSLPLYLSPKPAPTELWRSEDLRGILRIFIGRAGEWTMW